mmetsp:Transcript_53939/g.60311  ORF Transcript_53939/g.60311 Transcript_53939/m.60311 type:complete len:99 (-) Transcript_53939:1495-1791(-)
MESTTTEKKRRSPKKQQHYYTNEYKNHYNASVQNFIKYKLSSDPGYFAKRLEQRYYEICPVYTRLVYPSTCTSNSTFINDIIIMLYYSCCGISSQFMY